ncbi:MAG: hypothetical protein ABEJ65_04950 [bacterium]
MFSLPASVYAQPDDSYRKGLSFNKIKVTRQLASALKSGNHKVVLNSMKLMKPVWSKLNEKYPKSDDTPRTMFEDLKSAVNSGDKKAIRSSALTFLYIDTKDMLTLAEEFVKAGKSSRAKVYIKKSLMIYKAGFERNLKNQSEKKKYIRKANLGLQKMNQALSSPDKFSKHKQSVLKSLREMFPSIDA